METNEQLYARIKEWYNNHPGNDLEGMHIGVATELGTFIPRLFKPVVLDLWNTPDEGSPISISMKVGSYERTFVLENPEVVTENIDELYFLDETVFTSSPQLLESKYYRYSDGAIVTETKVVLLSPILRDIAVANIKEDPTQVIYTPGNNELLVPAMNIEFKVVYNHTDIDGFQHINVTERYFSEVACLDQIDHYFLEEDVDVYPIGPSSELFEEVISFYPLADKRILDVITLERYNEIIDEIREEDDSPWRKTKVDTSFFDEKYASKFIVQKTEYDNCDFEEERTEIII